jgi:hypothetical protein
MQKRPSRQHQIAIHAVLQADVRLIKPRIEPEVIGQQLRLIVAARTPYVTIHLLQADDVGVLRLDHADYALQAIAAIASADPLVDVVTE